MAKLRKSFLKTIMVFVVFFTTIAPVYAAGNASSLSLLQKDTSEIQAQDRAMPCHKSVVQSAPKDTKQAVNTISTEKQVSCFKHCLNYLNKPWLATKKLELKQELAEKNKADVQTSLSNSLRPIMKGSLLSRAPPIAAEFQHTSFYTPKNKGLSKLLLMTARLRD